MNTTTFDKGELEIMRKVRSILFAIVAVISVSAMSVSAQNFAPKRAPQSLGEQVYKKLRYLPYYSVFDNITYEIKGSTVILGGKVDSLGTKRQAEAAVKDIPGITEVVNNIDQLSPSPGDDRIRREAYRTFVSRGPAQYFSTIAPDVRIIVENGRITLEGYVSNQSDKNMLNILANGVSGAFQVTNNLIVGKRSF